MIWILLIIFVVLLLALDLFVLHKKGGAVSNQKAAIETTFWILIAASFSLVIYWIYQEGLVPNVEGLSPKEALVKYFSGYLIELSLSVDNLFVIAMIFASFGIPLQYQHKTLFWGILGAIVLRGLMIAFGIVLIRHFSWVTYVFGAFLFFTAWRMLFQAEGNATGTLNKFVNRFLKIEAPLDGEKFWAFKAGRRVATPLFGALVMIELTDLLFALDSIPAILAITTDPFLVFSSNIFAILGLRSMYFFLANMLKRFHHLKYSVFAILLFVSVKLVTANFYHFPEWISLAFIGTALLLGVLVSLFKKEQAETKALDTPEPLAERR